MRLQFAYGTAGLNSMLYNYNFPIAYYDAKQTPNNFINSNTKYLFKVFPIIKSINNLIGYETGGQRLEINGVGFNSEEDTNVFIGEDVCNIESITHNKIVCFINETVTSSQTMRKTLDLSDNNQKNDKNSKNLLDNHTYNNLKNIFFLTNGAKHFVYKDLSTYNELDNADFNYNIDYDNEKVRTFYTVEPSHFDKFKPGIIHKIRFDYKNFIDPDNTNIVSDYIFLLETNCKVLSFKKKQYYDLYDKGEEVPVYYITGKNIGEINSLLKTSARYQDYGISNNINLINEILDNLQAEVFDKNTNYNNDTADREYLYEGLLDYAKKEAVKEVEKDFTIKDVNVKNNKIKDLTKEIYNRKLNEYSYHSIFNMIDVTLDCSSDINNNNNLKDKYIDYYFKIGIKLYDTFLEYENILEDYEDILEDYEENELFQNYRRNIQEEGKTAKSKAFIAFDQIDIIYYKDYDLIIKNINSFSIILKVTQINNKNNNNIPEDNKPNNIMYSRQFKLNDSIYNIKNSLNSVKIFANKVEVDKSESTSSNDSFLSKIHIRILNDNKKLNSHFEVSIITNILEDIEEESKKDLEEVLNDIVIDNNNEHLLEQKKLFVLLFPRNSKSRLLHPIPPELIYQQQREYSKDNSNINDNVNNNENQLLSENAYINKINNYVKTIKVISKDNLAFCKPGICDYTIIPSIYVPEVIYDSYDTASTTLTVGFELYRDCYYSSVNIEQLDVYMESVKCLNDPVLYNSEITYGKELNCKDNEESHFIKEYYMKCKVHPYGGDNKVYIYGKYGIFKTDTSKGDRTKVIDIIISTIEPKIAKASGGVEISISGLNFPSSKDDFDDFIVCVYGNPCTISHVSNKLIKCIVLPKLDIHHIACLMNQLFPNKFRMLQPPSNKNNKIQVFPVLVKFNNAFGVSSLFEYSTDQTSKRIISIYPNLVPPGESVNLIITLSSDVLTGEDDEKHFNISQIKIYLIGQRGYLKEGDIKELIILNISSRLIIARYTPIDQSVYSVIINFNNKFSIHSNDINIDNRIILNSIDKNEGSIKGGTLINLIGQNLLSHNNSNQSVYIGEYIVKQINSGNTDEKKKYLTLISPELTNGNDIGRNLEIRVIHYKTYIASVDSQITTNALEFKYNPSLTPILDLIPFKYATKNNDNIILAYEGICFEIKGKFNISDNTNEYIFKFGKLTILDKLKLENPNNIDNNNNNNNDSNIKTYTSLVLQLSESIKGEFVFKFRTDYGYAETKDNKEYYIRIIEDYTQTLSCNTAVPLYFNNYGAIITIFCDKTDFTTRNSEIFFYNDDNSEVFTNENNKCELIKTSDSKLIEYLSTIDTKNDKNYSYVQCIIRDAQFINYKIKIRYYDKEYANLIRPFKPEHDFNLNLRSVCKNSFKMFKEFTDVILPTKLFNTFTSLNIDIITIDINGINMDDNENIYVSYKDDSPKTKIGIKVGSSNSDITLRMIISKTSYIDYSKTTSNSDGTKVFWFYKDEGFPSGVLNVMFHADNKGFLAFKDKVELVIRIPVFMKFNNTLTQIISSYFGGRSYTLKGLNLNSSITVNQSEDCNIINKEKNKPIQHNVYVCGLEAEIEYYSSECIIFTTPKILNYNTFKFVSGLDIEKDLNSHYYKLNVILYSTINNTPDLYKLTDDNPFTSINLYNSFVGVKIKDKNAMKGFKIYLSSVYIYVSEENSPSDLINAVIEGSDDGSNWTNITKLTDIIPYMWSRIIINNNNNDNDNKKKSIYSYIRLKARDENKAYISEIRFYGNILIDSDQTKTSCGVTIEDLYSNKNNFDVINLKVLYDSTRTLILSNLLINKIDSKNRNKVYNIATIVNYIDSFDLYSISDINSIKVFVYEQQATNVSIINSNELKFLIPKFKIPLNDDYQKLRINIPGYGDVVINYSFEYEDNWSSYDCWSEGYPPDSGSNVTISHKRVILDVQNIMLNTLKIEKGGILEFKRNIDHKIIVSNIIVLSGGILLAGDVENPFTNNINIEFNASQEEETIADVSPLFSNNILGSIEGNISLYGIPLLYNSMYLLENSLKQTDIIYCFIDKVIDNKEEYWNEGDLIIISSYEDNLDSGLEENEIKEVVFNSFKTINNIKSTVFTIKLKSLLKKNKIINKYNLNTIKVSKLNRNIKIKMSNKVNSFYYGPSIVIASSSLKDYNRPKYVRLSSVEIIGGGQGSYLGRSPISFQNLGILNNDNNNFIVDNCSIRNSSGAFNIHGSSKIIIKDNITYNISGPSLITEEGLEFDNEIINNSFIKNTPSYLSQTLTVGVAMYLKNFQNMVNNNYIINTEGTGIIISIPKQIVGSYLPAGKNINLNETKLNSFNDNITILCNYGIRVTDSYDPKLYPGLSFNKNKNYYQRGFLKRNKFYKQIYGLSFENEIGSISVIDSEFVNVKNSISINAVSERLRTNTDLDNTVLYNNKIICDDDYGCDYEEVIGISLPYTDNLNIRNQISELSDKYNYKFYLLSTSNHQTKVGARTTIFTQVNFDDYKNFKKIIKWNPPYNHILKDTTKMMYYTSRYPFVEDIKECEVKLNEEDSVKCSRPIVRIEVIAVHEIVNETFTPVLNIVSLLKNDTNSIIDLARVTSNKVMKLKPSENIIDKSNNVIIYKWGLSLVVGYRYFIMFDSLIFYSEKTKFLIVTDETYNKNFLHISLIFGSNISYNYKVTEYNLTNNEYFDVVSIANNYINVNNLLTKEQENINTYILNTAKEIKQSPVDDIQYIKDTESQKSSHGSNYNDTENSNFYLRISGTESNTLIKLELLPCSTNCSNTDKYKVLSWSDIKTWPNKKLPSEGDSIEIKFGDKVKLDIKETPRLKEIKINGLLFPDSTIDNIKINVERIVIEKGSFQIGTKLRPYEKNITVFFVANESSDSSFNIGKGTLSSYPSNLLINFNKLNLNGLDYGPYNSKLKKELFQDVKLYVDTNLKWNKGDELLITNSDHLKDHQEKVIIKSYNPVTGEITLNSIVQFYHYGAEDAQEILITDDALNNSKIVFDERAEVINLTRNIRLEAELEFFGGSLISSTINYEGTLYESSLNITNTMFVNFGKYNQKQHGILIEGTSNSVDNEISGLSIINSKYSAIKFLRIKDLIFKNSIIYEPVKSGVEISDCINFELLNIRVYYLINYVQNQIKSSIEENVLNNNNNNISPVKSTSNSYDKVEINSCFNICPEQNICENVKKTNLVCGGSDMYGYFGEGLSCDEEKDNFKDIFTYATRGGVVITNPNKLSCVKIKNIVSYNNYGNGILSSIVADKIIVENVLVSNNENGIVINSGSSKDIARIEIINSVIQGNSDINMDCVQFDNDINNSSSSSSTINNKKDYFYNSSNISRGLLIPSISESQIFTPYLNINFPLENPCCDSHFDGRVLVDNVLFKNFDYYNKDCNLIQYAISTNKYNLNSNPFVLLNNIKLHNVLHGSFLDMFTPYGYIKDDIIRKNNDYHESSETSSNDKTIKELFNKCNSNIPCNGYFNTNIVFKNVKSLNTDSVYELKNIELNNNYFKYNNITDLNNVYNKILNTEEVGASIVYKDQFLNNLKNSECYNIDDKPLNLCNETTSFSFHFYTSIISNTNKVDNHNKTDLGNMYVSINNKIFNVLSPQVDKHFYNPIIYKPNSSSYKYAVLLNSYYSSYDISFNNAALPLMARLKLVDNYNDNKIAFGRSFRFNYNNSTSFIVKVKDKIIEPLKVVESYGYEFDSCGKHVIDPMLNKFIIYLTDEIDCDVTIFKVNSLLVSFYFNSTVEEWSSIDNINNFTSSLSNTLGIDSSYIRISNIYRGSSVVYTHVLETNDITSNKVTLDNNNAKLLNLFNLSQDLINKIMNKEMVLNIPLNKFNYSYSIIDNDNQETEFNNLYKELIDYKSDLYDVVNNVTIKFSDLDKLVVNNTIDINNLTNQDLQIENTGFQISKYWWIILLGVLIIISIIAILVIKYYFNKNKNNSYKAAKNCIKRNSENNDSNKAISKNANSNTILKKVFNSSKCSLNKEINKSSNNNNNIDNLSSSANKDNNSDINNNDIVLEENNIYNDINNKIDYTEKMTKSKHNKSEMFKINDNIVNDDIIRNNLINKENSVKQAATLNINLDVDSANKFKKYDIELDKEYSCIDDTVKPEFRL